MSRARFFLSAAGLLLLTGMVHNQLVKSEPAGGATLRVSPTEVKLWFKERPEVALTSVTLMRADTTRIPSAFFISRFAKITRSRFFKDDHRNCGLKKSVCI